MKKAKISGIAAVFVACPDCSEDCENSRGSLMIVPGDAEVSCASCVKSWQVDQNAFRVRSGKRMTTKSD